MALAIVFRTMSGHSKWSQIKRQKGANDVKRGAIFTKMTREVMLAAREGGGDPDGNFRLRLAMDRARAVNVPLANIQRAIDKAVGGAEGAQVESIVYEGYGPGGVSIMVEAATDSRNRTAAEVRAAFTRHNGKLGESGSVQWLFEQKGLDRKSTRLNSSHSQISYAVFCLKKKKQHSSSCRILLYNLLHPLTRHN